MDTTPINVNIINMGWETWLSYIAVVILGAFASSLVLNKGSLVWPRWKSSPDITSIQEEKAAEQVTSQSMDKPKIKMPRIQLGDIGFLGDVIVGLAAGMAVLWTLNPQTLFQLIGYGAIAGYGGSTILQTLVTKITATSSQKESEKLSASNEAQAKAYQKIQEKQAELTNTRVEELVIESILQLKKKKE